MRHGSSNNGSQNRRHRSRNNNGGNRRKGTNKSHVYDSNGPDVRIRGTAHQIAEKYETLAKDSSSSGDYIMAESYRQHAEHYLRIIASLTPAATPARDNNEQFKKKEEAAVSDDSDLSLPASIVGAKAEVKSQEEIAETV